VPVGKDQVQHVEITRDIAIKFNNDNGNILKIPTFKTDDKVATVPGIDGAKMSKSYKNTINIFTTQKELKKQTGKIITDSTPLEEPKSYENCNVYKLCELFMQEDELMELQIRYKSGKEGYGHFKASLKDAIWNYFSDARDKRAYYTEHKDEVRDILSDGAKKAKKIASQKMEIIRDTVGII
jgi:tryptophanyl-tRNA synthetase